MAQENTLTRLTPQSSSLAPVGNGARAVASFTPTSFDGLVQVANMMAASAAAVPKHLRNNPGMCLSVAMVAYQNGFNPWLLAADSYVVNDVLAYGAKALIAMVNNSSHLNGRLHYDLSGAWPARVCTVSGKVKGDEREKVLPIQAETITTRNSPLWKQQPDQQLIYFATRAWCRIYMPEVLLGLIDRDEAEGLPQNQADGYGQTAQTTRPTRQDVVLTIDQTQDPFEWVSQDGEVVEMDAVKWGDTFSHAISVADDLSILEGIWDSNSGMLSKLDSMGMEIPAERLRSDYQQKREALAPPQKEQKTIPVWTPDGVKECVSVNEFLVVLEAWLKMDECAADVWDYNKETVSKVRAVLVKRADENGLAILNAVCDIVTP